MKFLFVEINRRACRFFVFRVGKVVHAYVGYPGRANFLQEDLQPVDITKPEVLLDVVDAVEHHAQPFGQILLQEAANDIDEIVRERRTRTKLGIDDLVVDLLLISILRTRGDRRTLLDDRRSLPKTASSQRSFRRLTRPRPSSPLQGKSRLTKDKRRNASRSVPPML